MPIHQPKTGNIVMALILCLAIGALLTALAVEWRIPPKAEPFYALSLEDTAYWHSTVDLLAQEIAKRKALESENADLRKRLDRQANTASSQLVYDHANLVYTVNDTAHVDVLLLGR